MLSHSRLEHLASPYGLATVSTAMFLAAWVFPPTLYRSCMDEPDYMFLDFRTLLFFGLCIASFLIGLRFAARHSDRANVRYVTRPTISPSVFIAIPLIVGTCFGIASIVLVIREYPAILLLMFSQGGNVIKNSDLVLKMPLGMANTWLLGIICWAVYRSRQLRLPKQSSRALNCLLFVSTATCFAGATMKLSRGELMPAIAGIAVIYLMSGIATQQLTASYAIRFAAMSAGIVIAAFLCFSVIRGSDAFVGDLVAYSFASYNRLTALLHYRLRYPFGGKGVYVVNFIAFNNTLNDVIPLREFFRWPDFMDVWRSEFDATWAAGLNGYSIFSTAFGYIFADLGWLAPLCVLAYGVAYGAVWKLIKRASVFGIVLYPWFAFCILFWFGTNYLLDNKIVVLVLDACLLWCYERLFAVTVIEQCKA